MSVAPPLGRYAGSGCSRKPEDGIVRERRVRAAHAILDLCDISMSPGKVSKLVSRYEVQVAGNGWTFADYFCNAVQLSEAQKQRALSDPDVVSRLDRRADPVGWRAAINVDRQRGWR